MTYSTPPGTSSAGTLNQAPAYDTGVYDPTIHDNQIVALYETDAQARAAEKMLVSGGVSPAVIQVIARGTDTGTLGGVNAEDTDHGIWATLRNLFAPDYERAAYSHAVGQGHAMLIVSPGTGAGTADERQTLIRLLESTDPVDFDAKLEQWRQAGYDSSTAQTVGTGSMTGAVGAGGDMSGNTGVRSGAALGRGGLVDERSPQFGAGTSTGPNAAGTLPRAPGMAETGTPERSAVTAAPVGTAGTEDTLKVLQEQLRVGKREVSAGMARIRSYVVERPVEEQVRLREERVSIERRPVDRAASPADMAAFQERTIEARATSEVPVVSKETRVVEEIGLKKEATEHVETVHDTVRKTEVEIEDETRRGQPAGKSTPGATTGATSSGTNAPRH